MGYDRCECGARKNEDYEFCFECKDQDVEVEFDLLLSETEKAYKVAVDGEEFWLPKSQTKALEEDFDTGVKAWIPRWLARSKDLI